MCSAPAEQEKAMETYMKYSKNAMPVLPQTLKIRNPSVEIYADPAKPIDYKEIDFPNEHP